MASFYASGLQFSCKRCSACCRYESGFVFLSENDMEILLKEMKMDRNSFIKTYCRWVADRGKKEVLSLKEKTGKDCILWNGGCSVYKARPLQCRTFPFWADIMISAKAWETAASGCPGMNSGKAYSQKEIEEILEMRKQQPIINRTGGSL